MADLATWTGIGAEVLKKYLKRESGEGSSDAGSFGLDIFINGFEDEFPADPDEGGVPYPTYSPEAGRASEQKPWGQEFGERPKIHELNQPIAAQELGWRVIDFYPNRDKKYDFHRFAGTPAELRLLLQLSQSLRFISGNAIDFDKWFEGWENGFPVFTENRSTGNYRLSASSPEQEKIWERIRDRDKRPRFRDWMSPNDLANLHHRTIEYFPKGFDGSSFILSGSSADLIRHIIAIEYESGGSGSASIETHNPIDIPILVGRPLVKLYFYSNENGKIGQGEISFRLMNESDSSLSKSNLRQLAQKIVDIFGKPTPYKWSKGVTTVSYNDRAQGLKGYYYSRTKADGIELIKKILAITGQEIDLKKCRVSECQDPSGAYPQSPPSVLILGETRKLPIFRPVIDVKFISANLFLSSLSQPIRLVDRSNRVLVDG